MPTLHWIGKEAVIGHHRQVPYHLLRCDNSLSCGDPDAGNLLVEGDNLLALKALLPYYAGQVKFIYIDPPYNTGNTEKLGGWRYNDNSDSPEIRRWLGDLVGPEGNDLSRHDKWLCMMYPRLALLRDFLRPDGLIFVSIDDNEVNNLRLLLDEIFGASNFQQQVVWKNKYGPGAMTKGFGNIHEYILCYSKTRIKSINGPLSPEEQAKYTRRDSKYAVRGGYITQPLMTRSKDDRPNLVYPITYNREEIWPDKQWIWSEIRLKKAIENDEVVFSKKKGKWSVRFKQYLRDENGHMRLGKPISILTGPFNQDGTNELRAIFGTVPFNNPKPKELVKYLLSTIVDGSQETDYTVMDSFCGSGTTGHALLELNKRDQGNRRFIGVEMDSATCADVSARRLEKVINGYEIQDGAREQVEGTGGGFQYCRLDKPLFDEQGKMGPQVKFADLAAHVFFTETGSPIPKQANGRSPFLGIAKGTAYYLLFNGVLGDRTPDGGNVLTSKVLATLPAHGGHIITSRLCAAFLMSVSACRQAEGRPCSPHMQSESPHGTCYAQRGAWCFG